MPVFTTVAFEPATNVLVIPIEIFGVESSATIEFICYCKSLVEFVKLTNLLPSRPLIKSLSNFTVIKSLTVKFCKFVSLVSMLSILEKSPNKDMI